jgi:hypothetical protein
MGFPKMQEAGRRKHRAETYKSHDMKTVGVGLLIGVDGMLLR